MADLIHDAGGFADVHMMVEQPERHLQEIAKAGADGITIHAEATPHLHYALQAIRDAGCTAGAAHQPGHAGRRAVGESRRTRSTWCCA